MNSRFQRANSGRLVIERMKITLIFLGALTFGGCTKATEFDAFALLERDLGKTIQVISKSEIRYCPDNTCEIYRIKESKDVSYLPSFLYLYLFHQSEYIYLKESDAGSRPFRERAKNSEGSVRKHVESFCEEINKTPTCILNGMKMTLGITVTFGRYDEGQFNESRELG